MDHLESYEIELPTKHVCGERCQYVYVFGFPCGKNPQYIDGKCDKQGTVQDHSSPPIRACFDPEIWAHLHDTGEFIKHDEVVITDSDIKICFNYPLSHPVEFDFHSDLGFQRKQLVDLIAQTYKKIYDEEEATIEEQKVVPLETRIENGGLINRNATDGKYGIWGHDMGDLWLEGIQYDPETHTVSLSIGS